MLGSQEQMLPREVLGSISISPPNLLLEGPVQRSTLKLHAVLVQGDSFSVRLCRCIRKLPKTYGAAIRRILWSSSSHQVQQTIFHASISWASVQR